MPVFDASIKTRTRVRLDRDAFQPDMGSLVDSEFDEETHVHGTRQVTIDSDETHLITGFLFTRITESETRVVLTNQDIEIRGIVNLAVTSGWNEVHHGPVNQSFYQPVTEVYLSDHHVSVPSSFDFEVTMFDNALVIGTKIEICTGFLSSISTLAMVEVKNLSLELTNTVASGTLIDASLTAWEVFAEEAVTNIQIIRNTVSLEMNLQVIMNTAIHLSPPMPWG